MPGFRSLLLLVLVLVLGENSIFAYFSTPQTLLHGSFLVPQHQSNTCRKHQISLSSKETGTEEATTEETTTSSHEEQARNGEKVLELQRKVPKLKLTRKIRSRMRILKMRSGKLLEETTTSSYQEQARNVKLIRKIRSWIRILKMRYGKSIGDEDANDAEITDLQIIDMLKAKLDGDLYKKESNGNEDANDAEIIEHQIIDMLKVKGNNDLYKKESSSEKNERQLAQNFFVTATGPDRTGIVADLTKAVLDHDGSVGKSKMEKIGGDFCIVMKVDHIQDSKADSFKTIISRVPGMKVTVYPASIEPEPPVLAPKFRATFNLEGADSPGLVYSVTTFLGQHGIWINELQTEVKSAPSGGKSLFMMKGKATSDIEVDVCRVRKGFKELENELNVNLFLSESEV
mmetsp:Transcript_26768/g.34516  ORF Transcript_26768/g.34516 Transcript_26768/m.34516 type:complete len:401 (+) Transcript_26768:158-1360(+)